MVKVAVLFILPALIISACGDNTNNKVQKQAPKPVEVAEVIYPSATDLSSWAAWLGLPGDGQRIISTPSRGQEIISYISARDITRVEAGLPPLKAITIKSQRIRSNDNQLEKVLKPRRKIKTSIGLAYVQPDGLRAYIPTSTRLVIVEAPRSSLLRPNLERLRWVEDSVKNPSIKPGRPGGPS